MNKRDQDMRKVGRKKNKHRERDRHMYIERKPLILCWLKMIKLEQLLR